MIYYDFKNYTLKISIVNSLYEVIIYSLQLKLSKPSILILY